MLNSGQVNCISASVQTYTIKFSPAFATVLKFAMDLVALQRETQSET